MRTIATLAAALLVTIPGVASAASPCLTPPEFAAVAQFALPSVISGAAARCAPALSTDSFLRHDGAAMSARYAEASRQSWPQAKQAFLKLSAADGKDASGMLASMPDDSLKQIVDGFVQGAVVSRLPIEQCPLVDQVIRLIAPLPAGNTAQLVATLVALGASKKDGKLGPLSICQA